MDEAAAMVTTLRDGLDFGLGADLDRTGFMMMNVAHGVQVARVTDDQEYRALVKKFGNAVTSRNAKREGPSKAEKQALHEALEQPMPATPLPEDLTRIPAWAPDRWAWN
jgi:hypothetical protein